MKKDLQKGKEYQTHNSSVERSKSQMGKQNFNVVVRIRPVDVGDEIKNEMFTRDDLRKVVARVNDREIKLSKPMTEDKFFTFDKVLKHTTKQEETFEYVCKSFVSDSLNGYNATVMTYGQTGSGKTYTVFGKENSIYNDKILDDEAGIVPRSIVFFFKKMKEDSKKFKYKITVSFFQIYLEQITDLIPNINDNEIDNKKKNNKDSINMDFSKNTNTTNKAKKEIGEGLKIREDPNNGVYIQGLKSIQVESEEQLFNLIKYAINHRITQQTNVNLTSSRSHAILRINFEKKTVSDQYKSKQENNIKTIKGCLTFVDLAGSEKSKLTEGGLRKEESKYINISIYHLGTVVFNLAHNNHVNFRDSSLTRVLKDSLTKNTKCSIIATVSPFLMNYEETLTTLQFASLAKTIKVSVTANVTLEMKNLKDNLNTILSYQQFNISQISSNYGKICFI